MSYNYASFAIADIVNILMTTNNDYVVKKSSLEQLTMLLFDQLGRRGRTLYEGDLFNRVLDDIVEAYNTVQEKFAGKLAGLGREHLLYLNECLRFVFYSYIFYNQEPVV